MTRYRRFMLLSLGTLAVSLAALTWARAAAPRPPSGPIPASPSASSQTELLEVVRVAINDTEVLQKMHTLVARHGLHLGGFVFRYDSLHTATWVMIYLKGDTARAQIEVEVRRPVPGGPPAVLVRITGPTPIGDSHVTGLAPERSTTGPIRPRR